MGRVLRVRHEDANLEQLERDPSARSTWPQAVVKAFRRRMQAIRAAHDERDLANVRGNRFEKLKGKRKDEYSVRLNDQYRLILGFEGSGSNRTVVIIAIEDYH
jgi:toxin HigB-1